MLNPEQIICLYDNVLCTEEFYYSISQTRIKMAIQNMAAAYKPDNTKFYRKGSDFVTNYNNPAYRCAYLHKYAPLHTCLVQKMFHLALTECFVLQNNLFSKYGRFKICSLGGGPGTDIIGIISACQPFGLLQCSTQVIDLMSEWKNTFNFIVEELQHGSYGKLSLNLNAEYFNCSYIASNLLQAIDSRTYDSIRSADLITMIKFISAAPCRDTEGMVKNIFDSMKPGAFVFFIDNAAGGFGQMISRLAQQCDLVTIFGPLNHYQYTKPELSVIRFGYVSCFETKVTVQILMKASHSTYLNNLSLNNQSRYFVRKSVSNARRNRNAHNPYSNRSDLIFSSDNRDSQTSGTMIIFVMLILCLVIYFDSL